MGKNQRHCPLAHRDVLPKGGVRRHFFHPRLVARAFLPTCDQLHKALAELLVALGLWFGADVSCHWFFLTTGINRGSLPEFHDQKPELARAVRLFLILPAPEHRRKCWTAKLHPK